MSQSVCPWNVKFSQELADDSPFRAREFIAGKDSQTLAQDIPALDQEQFSAAFRKSPLKRAKLAGLRRNAAVVLGNLASAEGFPAHVSALSDPDPVVRSYAARALGRLATKPALTALRDRLREEAHESVRRELLAALQKPSGPKSPIW